MSSLRVGILVECLRCRDVHDLVINVPTSADWRTAQYNGLHACDDGRGRGRVQILLTTAYASQ